MITKLYTKEKRKKDQEDLKKKTHTQRRGKKRNGRKEGRKEINK